jgi:UDP-N-acetylglucosamine:LPS N-acetylglucosamine transferase
MPITQVCEKYGVNKGTVQNLQQAAATFAGKYFILAQFKCNIHLYRLIILYILTFGWYLSLPVIYHFHDS